MKTAPPFLGSSMISTSQGLGTLPSGSLLPLFSSIQTLVRGISQSMATRGIGNYTLVSLRDTAWLTKTFSKNLTAWHGGDNLVAAVAAQNKNTIVVVHSVGPLIVEPWIDHPNVTAVGHTSISTALVLTDSSGAVGWCTWARSG